MSFVKDNFVFIHIPKTGGTSIASVFDEKASHQNLDYYKLNQHIKLLDYFKFAFVRNPYDRYASILNGYEDTSATKTQFSFIQVHGLVAVDFVGRFENIDEDWKKICNLLGIKKELPHLNKGKKHKKLTKEQIEFVNKAYDIDFKTFNYPKCE